MLRALERPEYGSRAETDHPDFAMLASLAVTSTETAQALAERILRRVGLHWDDLDEDCAGRRWRRLHVVCSTRYTRRRLGTYFGWYPLGGVAVSRIVLYRRWSLLTLVHELAHHVVSLLGQDDVHGPRFMAAQRELVMLTAEMLEGVEVPR
jgi:hypothetical protein